MLGVNTVVVTALVTCHDHHEDDNVVVLEHEPGPGDDRQRARSLPDIQEESDHITNIS